MVSRFRSFTMLIALTLLFTAGAWAQGGGTGDLTGTVMDPTGAVVPGAKLTLTNDATGVVRTAETNEVGLFRFVSLPIVGTYNLKVAATGFKTYEAAKIVMTVGRTVTLDVKLEIGAAQEVLTVEAGEQLVQTSESQLSGLVDRRVWQTVPLEQRNPNSFINILAGVVPDDFGGTTRGAAVNGMRPGSGNFLVEGYDNNDQGQGGRGALVAGGITSISPEAIQEYRVVTNGYAAEFGKGGGFVNDMVLKSGTNDIHGGLFWYNRVQALAANDFFTNKARQDELNGGGPVITPNDHLVRNQFGGSLGGPIIKDRSFIYGTYEGHLRRSGSPRTGTGFTQEFQNFVQSGAFRTFHETNPAGICIVFTGAACPGAFTSAGTLGSKYQNTLLPLRNFPFAPATSTNPDDFESQNVWFGGNAYPVQVFGFITGQASTGLNEHRVSIKNDNRISDKDTINYTFMWEDSDTFSSLDGGDVTFGPAYASPGGSILTGITYQRTFTPSVLNTAKFSYLRHTRDFPKDALNDGVPSIFTGDALTVGFGQSANLPQFFTENLFQVQNHTSVVKGSHSFKFGGEYRRTRNGSSFEALRDGIFGYWSVEDLLTDGAFTEAADQFLYGGAYYGAFYYAGASIDPTRPGQLPEYYRGYRANEIAWYVQDDWKIHPRLTVNAGLRWEYFGPPHNFRSGIDSNFYFGQSVTPIAPSCAPPALPGTCTGNLFFPTADREAATVRTGAFQQRDHSIWEKDTNNFAPRIGFAYDVMGNQKWILRGAYGIYYDRMWNNLFENIRFNAPFFAFASQFAPAFGGAAPIPSSLLTIPFASRAAFAAAGAIPSPRHMDQNLVTSYAQQFNLNLQYQFARDYVLEVAGVGTMGNKLLGVVDINTFNGRNRGGNSARINNTIAGDNYRTNLFRSNYYGLQTTVRKNFSNGLQFNANYTWSHAIDYVSDAFNNARGASLRPTDNRNWRIDRGNADFDVRHRFVLSYLYELPWWKQNRWLGGWTFSGISALQTGVPVPLLAGGNVTSRDANADGYRTDRPRFLGTSISSSIMDSNSPADGYIDVAQFDVINSSAECPAGLPNGGQIISTTRWWCNSDLGRGVLIGPGFANFDFGVHKAFKVTEQVKLTFQANFFNIFNRPNFAVPDGNMNSSTFGSSIATVNGAGGGSGARVTQLALRIDF